MTDPLFTRLHIAALTASLIVVMVFSAFPALDLAISHAFTAGTGGFRAAAVPAIGLLNAVIRRVLELLAFASVLLTLAALLLRLRPQSGIRNWLFLSLVLLAGPGLIVNLLLKAHSGRARPAHVLEFGGAHPFTPMLRFAEHCSSNCSFSSGETALSSALVFAGLALVWPRLRRRRGLVLAAGLALIGLTLLLRVALGRHFASDVLFSVSVSAFVCLGAYRLTGVASSRAALTVAALRADGLALAGLLRDRGAPLWRRLPRRPLPTLR